MAKEPKSLSADERDETPVIEPVVAAGTAAAERPPGLSGTATLTVPVEFAQVPAADADPEKTTYLTTRHSTPYGPKGRFLDLCVKDAEAGLADLRTPEQVERDPEGKPVTILRPPTDDELSRRRP